jgi:hypothetical protein
MHDHWDELSKLLAESLPRRESLRRLGALFAGAVLSPLAIGTTWAKGPDPCKAFCNRCPKNQQSQCLAACHACNGDTSRVCGKCGNYTCCATPCCGGTCSDLASDPNCGACGNNCSAQGLTCCGGQCADLRDDFYNCGSCGNTCDDAQAFEAGVCVNGECLYGCVDGTLRCNGACTPVLSDPNNCGACGHVCDGATPYCNQGTCVAYNCGPGLAYCGGYCADLYNDPDNCGACGFTCSVNEFCTGGVCEPAYVWWE